MSNISKVKSERFEGEYLSSCREQKKHKARGKKTCEQSKNTLKSALLINLAWKFEWAKERVERQFLVYIFCLTMLKTLYWGPHWWMCSKEECKLRCDIIREKNSLEKSVKYCQVPTKKIKKLIKQLSDLSGRFSYSIFCQADRAIASRNARLKYQVTRITFAKMPCLSPCSLGKTWQSHLQRIWHSLLYLKLIFY